MIAPRALVVSVCLLAPVSIALAERRPDPNEARAGVIVDPNGYILTNHHVIENAQDIIVRLSDSRKYTTTLVGRDPKTDLAVLKVDATGPLPAAELAGGGRNQYLVLERPGQP